MSALSPPPLTARQQRERVLRRIDRIQDALLADAPRSALAEAAKESAKLTLELLQLAEGGG